jgi:hypothetical protein
LAEELAEDFLGQNMMVKQVVRVVEVKLAFQQTAQVAQEQ